MGTPFDELVYNLKCAHTNIIAFDIAQSMHIERFGWVFLEIEVDNLYEYFVTLIEHRYNIQEIKYF